MMPSEQIQATPTRALLALLWVLALSQVSHSLHQADHHAAVEASCEICLTFERHDDATFAVSSFVSPQTPPTGGIECAKPVLHVVGASDYRTRAPPALS